MLSLMSNSSCICRLLITAVAVLNCHADGCAIRSVHKPSEAQSETLHSVTFKCLNTFEDICIAQMEALKVHIRLLKGLGYKSF